MSEPSDSLQERMRKLGIRDADLEETFAHSSGPGGQNVNKVATAVRLRHLPSGISVTVQDSRSQMRNRQLARGRLVDALERIAENQRKERVALRERERRRSRPRPRALKKKILETKRKRSVLKKLRGRVVD
jgi:protein subunit release factor B